MYGGIWQHTVSVNLQPIQTPSLKYSRTVIEHCPSVCICDSFQDIGNSPNLHPRLNNIWSGIQSSLQQYVFQNVKDNIIWAYSFFTLSGLNTRQTLDSFICHDFLQVTVDTSEWSVGKTVSKSKGNDNLLAKYVAKLLTLGANLGDILIISDHVMCA